MKISVEQDDYLGRDGRATIQLVLCKGGRARKRLDVRVEVKHWDRRRQRVKTGHPNAGALNRTIEAAIHEAEKICAEIPGIDPWTLRDKMRGAVEGSFVQIALADLADAPPKSWHTKEQRKQRIAQFDRAFPGILASAVGPQVFARYKAMLEKRGISANSVASQLRSLRTVYNRVCKRAGIVPVRVLEGLGAVEKYSAPKAVLSPAEVERLRAYARKRTGWERRSVHMWMFSLFCGGIRWTDLCRLTQKNIQGGRVVFIASKTGKAKNVPLFSEARSLVEKKGTTLFNTPTHARGIANVNVVANAFLKRAAKACRISKRLHTHSARHTSAAFLFNEGVDDRVIMEILGVDGKSFAHYKASITTALTDAAMRRTFG